MEGKNKIYNQELLSDPELLNSKIGAQLIDNYSKTNPEEACECLVKAFGGVPAELIANIDEYRSGLVFTLSRLCFNKSTFERAAWLMLRFAATEQDDANSYGRIGLVRLFFPRLGATEADLRMRLRFIGQCAQKAGYANELLKMLNACLSFQVAYLHDGTERLAGRTMAPYSPQPGEIHEYVAKSIELLVGYDGTALRENAEAIIGDHFIEVCREGLADVVLPRAEEICKKRQNRWDTLLDNLLMFKNDMKGRMSPELYERYKGLIVALSSDDFEFRFKRVEKELYASPSRFSTEKLMSEQRARYKALGEEFCERELFTPELLGALYAAEVITTSPFGEMVAKMLPEEQKRQFAECSVEILNGREKAQSDILVDYAYGLTDEEFEGMFGLLLTLKNKRIVFAAVARRSTKFKNRYSDALMDLVRKGEVSAELFVTYWSNFRFMYMNDEEIASWMRKLKELPDGSQTVLHILQSAISGEAFQTNQKMVAVAVETVTEMEVDYETLMRNYQYWNVLRMLLEKGQYPALAQRANEIMLGYVKAQSDFLISNYEVSQTYRLLLSKYFDTIWGRLSEELLSDEDDGWVYYRLKNIMGSMIGGPYNEIGLLFEQDHSEALMDWCRSNPAIAPARLMEMVPVFEGKGFSKIVYMLLDEFGENRQVLDALSHNMGCFGWTGSVNVLYEKEIKALDTLKEHQHQTVRDWCEKMILIIKNDMEKEDKIWR